MDESFGIYPSGVNTQGVKSNYKNHIDSKGMGMLNIQLKPTESSNNLWNGYIENVLNTAMLEVNHELKIRKGKHTFLSGLDASQNRCC
ncbi:hypothetical protein EMGBS15_14740 [Filimonas sp.]|nr:hypothetical protein EMGBS15_14740 [Filimonas sp.]